MRHARARGQLSPSGAQLQTSRGDDAAAGKVAVVTGAGSGIGRGMAVRFAAAGMRLALSDVDAEALAATASLLDDVAGSDLLVEALDVTDGAAVEAHAANVFARFGQVDLLCNNAGVFSGGLLWERADADLEFALGVNVYGILHGVRAFVPRMIERGVLAHVVNTVSVAGLFGSPFAGPYSVSKFAAFAATESLAGDLVASGSAVRAHALCPGNIRTRIAESERLRPAALATPRTPDQEFVEQMLAAVVEEGMEPEAVADLVLEALSRPDDFLILTHPEFAEQLVERAHTLAARQLPGLPDFG